jgi:hypothetical protein
MRTGLRIALRSLGAVIIGAFAATAGARSGLVLGAAGAIAAGAVGLWSLARARELPKPHPLDSPLT